jgi:hypothetical protein
MTAVHAAPTNDINDILDMILGQSMLVVLLLSLLYVGYVESDMKEDKSIHLGTPLCESMIQLVI